MSPVLTTPETIAVISFAGGYAEYRVVVRSGRVDLEFHEATDEYGQEFTEWEVQQTFDSPGEALQFVGRDLGWSL